MTAWPRQPGEALTYTSPMASTVASDPVLDHAPREGVRTFTPGPDGGGRYVIEVFAGVVGGAQPYRLRVGSAGPDRR